MVDWSYSLLDGRERTTFARLGVFAGSFDAAAAQSVVSDEEIDRFDVLDALNELVAKSMVVAEPGPEGSTRYLLLETLRQYALEHLDVEGAGDRFRRRHAQYYAEFIERAAPALNGPEELIWKSRIATEIDDLRSAVTWALDRDDPADAEYSMRIIRATHGRVCEEPRRRNRTVGGTSHRSSEHQELNASELRSGGGGVRRIGSSRFGCCG